MTQLELTIEISPIDTETINRQGKVIALAQPFGAGAGGPEVLWVLFAPFETNRVEWQTDYGLFASPDPVESDTVITASSILPQAEPGLVYPFADGVFGTPIPSSSLETYSIRNASGDSLTFGLTQTVTANGERFDSAPVVALPVPVGESGEFLPRPRVKVFLFRKTENGVVVIIEKSRALELDFGDEPNQTIHYDGTGFAVGPLG